MSITRLRNIVELTAFINAVLAFRNGKPPQKLIDQADAKWFVAMTDARIMLDGFSMKDLAQSLIDGIPAIDVEVWLNTLFEDYDFCKQEGCTDEQFLRDYEDPTQELADMIAHHFNVE